MGAILTDWEMYPQSWICSLPAIVYFAHRMRGRRLSRMELASEIDRIAGGRVGASLLELGDVYRKVSDLNDWYVYDTSIRQLLILGEDYPWGQNGSTRDRFREALGAWRQARSKADLTECAQWIRDDFAVIDLIERAVEMRTEEPHKRNFRAVIEPEYRRLWLKQFRSGGLSGVLDTCFHSR